MYDVEYQSHGFRQAYKCGVVILINNYPTDGPLLASTCNIILPTFVGDIYKLVPLDNPAATCKMNENRNY
jgi:hypothetical protein